MVHWTKDFGVKSDIKDAVKGTRWKLDISDTDRGPVEIIHEDRSEVSIVRSPNTQTIAVEYTPSEPGKEAVEINRGEYHHESFGIGEPENAVEWAKNILKQHEDKN